MFRVSFRQAMLAGFVLVILLLGGMALHSWLVVEDFVEKSRRNSEQAMQLAASIQDLEQNTVDVERSVRQFLLLGDAAFRQRFDEDLGLSLLVLDRLEALDAVPLHKFLADWRETAASLREGLDVPSKKPELLKHLTHLSELNGFLKQAAQRSLEVQSSQVIGELEANRLRLGGQLFAALLGAVLVALAMGWWLVRPMRHLGQAIARLGEKRFEEAVAVGGPADLRQLGRQLDWLRQRLAELEADRDRTLRHVSHELKTPLTALREGVALLAEEVTGPLGEAQREVVGILQHNVIALQRQIEDLLSLNQAVFDARHLVFERLALPAFLAGVVRRRDLHAQARQVSVRLEAPEAVVTADAEKLAAVLDNLLSNAIDFSPGGGEVCLQASLQEGRLRLECIDQGPGVAPEDVERIFEPFVQGARRAPAPRRGSGVGLSIVRELASAMGGKVTLLPSQQGAHFCVEIPDET